MTASYTSPSNSDSDRLRFLLQDLDLEDPEFSDEEYIYLVDSEGSVQAAAVRAAEMLAARYAGFANVNMGSISISNSGQAANFRALAQQLAESGSSSAALPFVGGVRLSDKEARAADPDAPPPTFKR